MASGGGETGEVKLLFLMLRARVIWYLFCWIMPLVRVEKRLAEWLMRSHQGVQAEVYREIERLTRK